MASLALQRSKRWLEEKGWHVEIVERWNPWAHIRQDCFALHDLLAIRHDVVGVWGINAMEDNGEMVLHIRKYLDGYYSAKRGFVPANPHLPVWLAAGNRFSQFGWGLRSADGRGSRKVWTLRVVDFYLDGAEVKYKETAFAETKGDTP